jgi:hypothetical protein
MLAFLWILTAEIAPERERKRKKELELYIYRLYTWVSLKWLIS